MKVLVIEDSPEVTNSLRLCFKIRWPDAQIVAASHGAKGIEMVENESPDIIILDLGLPDMDGVEVLRTIRSFSQIPVVVLTVRRGEMDSVTCLEEGADDFITKPFSALGLLARIRAVLRRLQRLPADLSNTPFAAGNLLVNYASRQVSVSGRPVQLTPTEYSLLCYLISNRNRVLTHKAILGELWGEEYDEVNTLKTFISQLRRKLDDAGADSTGMIASVRGVVYKFVSSA